MATFTPVPWTWNDKTRFELAVIEQPLEENSQYFLQKPFEEVKNYSDALVSNNHEVEPGMFSLPKYPEDDYLPIMEAQIPNHKQPEKKRGTPWTKEEHELFLVGLKKFGKGDWKSISRECVKTRTSTQVASHAQKYFLRQNTDRKKRKRSSIHDITLKDDGEDVVTNVPDGSNLESMNQQQHIVEEYPPEWFYGNDEVANMVNGDFNASFPL